MTTSCAGRAARGLGLILSPSTPIPVWASRCKHRTATCKPDPKAYRAFVTALGRRYSGSYADENQGGGVLPRVTRWSLLNEPNQPGWLTPAVRAARAGGSWRPRRSSTGRWRAPGSRG